MDSADSRAREREEADRSADREPSVIELMNGPQRPSAERRNLVLWIALVFATAMLVMTCAVIGFYGLDILTLSTAAMLIVIMAAMIGALRYKGEDPMAQFDPQDREAPKSFWRRSR